MKKIAMLLMALFVVTSANFVNAQPENLPAVKGWVNHIPIENTFNVGKMKFFLMETEDGSLIITPNEDIYDFYYVATTMGQGVRVIGVFLESEIATLIISDEFKKIFAQRKAKELEKIAKLRDVSEKEKDLEKELMNAEKALINAKDKDERKLKEKSVASAEEALIRAEERREASLVKAIREHERNEAERDMEAMNVMDKLYTIEELNACYLICGFHLQNKANVPKVWEEVKKLQTSRKPQKEDVFQSEELVPLSESYWNKKSAQLETNSVTKSVTKTETETAAIKKAEAEAEVARIKAEAEAEVARIKAETAIKKAKAEAARTKAEAEAEAEAIKEAAVEADTKAKTAAADKAKAKAKADAEAEAKAKAKAEADAADKAKADANQKTVLDKTPSDNVSKTEAKTKQSLLLEKFKNSNKKTTE